MAARREALFRAAHGKSEPPPPGAAVAAALAASGVVPPLDAPALAALRRGAAAATPGQRAARAAHCGVPAASSTDDRTDEEVAAELALLTALRDADITGLSPCRRGDPDPDRPLNPAAIRRWAALLRAIGERDAAGRPATAP